MGSERGILQTVQFAEEIDFPRDARADAVLAARHRLAGRRYTLWDPAPLSAALHLKRRDERSAGQRKSHASRFLPVSPRQKQDSAQQRALRDADSAAAVYRRSEMQSPESRTGAFQSPCPDV